MKFTDIFAQEQNFYDLGIDINIFQFEIQLILCN